MFLKAVTFFSLILCLNGADDRVVVGFYGESLCPDCIQFATIDLNEAFIKACLWCASISNYSQTHYLVFTAPPTVILTFF